MEDNVWKRHLEKSFKGRRAFREVGTLEGRWAPLGMNECECEKGIMVNLV